MRLSISTRSSLNLLVTGSASVLDVETLDADLLTALFGTPVLTVDDLLDALTSSVSGDTL